jgi:MscS family membrane protein
MRQLLERIRNMLSAREKVDAESVVVFFTEFGDSALNILIRCFVWETEWAAFQAEKERINLILMDIVADVGLSVAFPSRSLYIENMPPVALDPAQAVDENTDRMADDDDEDDSDSDDEDVNVI